MNDHEKYAEEVLNEPLMLLGEIHLTTRHRAKLAIWKIQAQIEALKEVCDVAFENKELESLCLAQKTWARNQKSVDYLKERL